MLPQPVVLGGTYEWLLNATVNTETAPTVFGAWDLTAATVTVSFMPPSGAGRHFTATLVSGTGKARYINLASLFNIAGTWGVSWRVSQGDTILESQITYFTVYPSGAAA